MGKVISFRTILPSRHVAVWSLGAVLLLGAGFQTLPAQDDDWIYYFPHLAVGAKWQTTITYINYFPEKVTCRTEFLSDEGSPLPVSFAGLGKVVSRTDVLWPGGSVHEETNVEMNAPLAHGWARATCSGPVKASLLFRRYDSEGVPVAEAAVNATTVPASRFVTFAEQEAGQFGTGVAYANPSDTAAHITFTARDAAGQTLANVTRNLPPGGHGAQNMVHLFGLTSFVGSLEVTSTEPIVSLSLNFEADPVFSSLPPGEPDTSSQESTTYYFPHLAVGAGWQTTISFINYSPAEVSCQTDFLSDHGSPLLVSFTDLGRVVSRTDVLPPGGSVHEETNVEMNAPLAPGWARATCSGPVKASLLFRRYDSEGVPTGEAAVNAAAVPATRFVTFAEQGEGQFGTGVAYANPSSAAALVTFTAKDAGGKTLASVDHNLPPAGHGSQNMVHLFGLASFSGSIEVTSTEPIVSLSLNFEADPVFSSLPPGGLEERIHDPGTGPMTDREVLEVVYHATGGQNWNNRTNWLSALPLSRWHGVTTDGSGRVTRLDLSLNGLSGSIPPALGQLARLEWLDLSDNHLSKAIPPELATLTQLGDLWLRDNQLSGAIPPQLGQMTQLESLYLEDNQLSGSIPPELEGLSNLHALTLGGNQLSGSIPPELGGLTELQWLDLEENELTGRIPPELGRLSKLRVLGLEDNQLSGGIPPELGGLTELQWLFFQKNRLTGAIPPELAGLTQLELLHLEFNDLTGPLPKQFQQLSKLIALHIAHTGVCVPTDAAFQAWLDALPSYTSSRIACDGTRRVLFSESSYEVREGETVTVSVRLIDWTEDPAQSTEIDLTALPGGGATGADYSGVPERITISTPANEATFMFLAVSDDNVDHGETVVLGFGRPLPTGVTAGSPDTATVTIQDAATETMTDREVLEALFHTAGGPGWKNRTNWLSDEPLSRWHGVGADVSGRVTRLDLSLNGLSGSIPPALGQLARLEWLDLSDNQLSKAIPPELGTLTQLQRLDLEGNHLSGSIPPALGQLARLEWLSLGENDLTGPLPPELGGLRQLQWLFLGFNGLTGTIPPELGGLTQLLELSLQSNQLTGVIPLEFAGLTELHRLDLGVNQLSGTIPLELGGLTQLQWLFLGFNELTGTIPPELGGLTRLRELNLRSNQLSGVIPLELAELTKLQELELGSNRLSGGIPPELGGLTQLRGLNMEINRLSGRIPPELGRLTQLQWLFLGDNELSGGIPPELGGLIQLRSLLLGVNQLSGGIPVELGGLTQLRQLDLRRNYLSGGIPPELGGLTRLQRLDIGSNRLSGPIPPELGGLAQLQWLDLDFNSDLTGAIPPGLQQLPLSNLSLVATSVCVPEDAELQEWLATIEFVSSGLTCGRPADAISSIDIMVVYTPAARRFVGGTAEMEAKIDLMIAETNQAYLDSGVSQQLVLVARKEVEYTESREGAFTDTDRLASPSDGYMDEVHAIRDRAGADLVHLLAVNAPSHAEIMGAFGFTWVKEDALVFAHELGHNMGLHHNREVTPRSITFPYSHGYVNQRAFAPGAPGSAQWRTIMAYRPSQCANEGSSCEWILRFSNPNQTYLGDPLGVPGEEWTTAVNGPADAARTLNLTRYTVAGFRPRATGNQMTMSSTIPQARPMVRASEAAPLAPSGNLFRAIAPNGASGVSCQGGVTRDRATLRRREVRIATGRLPQVSEGRSTVLRLNLFDDVVLTGIIERRTPTYSGGTAFTGRLAGVPGGSVTLVVNGNVVAGTVRVPGAIYRILPDGSGRHAIMQVDPSQILHECQVVSGKLGGEQ